MRRTELLTGCEIHGNGSGPVFRGGITFSSLEAIELVILMKITLLTSTKIFSCILDKKRHGRLADSSAKLKLIQSEQLSRLS